MSFSEGLSCLQFCLLSLAPKFPDRDPLYCFDIPLNHCLGFKKTNTEFLLFDTVLTASAHGICENCWILFWSSFCSFSIDTVHHTIYDSQYSYDMWHMMCYVTFWIQQWFGPWAASHKRSTRETRGFAKSEHQQVQSESKNETPESTPLKQRPSSGCWRKPGHKQFHNNCEHRQWRPTSPDGQPCCLRPPTAPLLPVSYPKTRPTNPTSKPAPPTQRPSGTQPRGTCQFTTFIPLAHSFGFSALVDFCKFGDRAI